MIRVALAGLRHHKLRTLLTSVAIALGVSFLAGTLIYRDTAEAAFFVDLARPAANVDVAVEPRGGAGYGFERRVDESVPDVVRAVPGVAAVDARRTGELGVLDRNGRVITSEGYVGMAVSLPSVPELAMFRLVSGTLPDARGEAALDEPTVRRLGIQPGESFTVIDRAGKRRQLRLSAVVDYGASIPFAWFTVVAVGDADLTALVKPRGYAEVVATAEPGVSAEELTRRVRDAVGSGEYRVLAGDDLRWQLARASAKYAEGLLNTLLAAALVALVVSCLVVRNTFTILVAQRTRQLALLRCVGASRTQVFGLVVAESTVVGLVASAAGLAASAGVGRLLILGRDLFGDAVPDHSLVVRPVTVAAGLVVGVLTAIAAGVLPALAASRISPLAALRDGPEPRAATRRRLVVAARSVGAVGLGVLGLAVMAVGRRPGMGFSGTPIILAGAMACFVGIVVALPLVIGRLTALVGWLPARLFGITARLAGSSAARNPGRAAANTTALMIGIALLTMFTVVLDTARVQGERELDENFPIDFVVDPIPYSGSRQLPGKMVADLSARPEIGLVALTRTAPAWANGYQTTVSAIDPGDASIAGSIEVMAGSLADLGPGTVAIRRGLAYEVGLGVGDDVDLSSWDAPGPARRIVALYDDSPTRGDALVTWADLNRQFGKVAGDEVLVRKATSTSVDAAHAALDAVLDTYPLVSVESRAERKAALDKELDKRLSQFAGLLSISTIIAVLGIMSTLALSILERTRESATLRALGLGAGQLRRVFLLEALFMGLVAALLGVGFGVGAGWVTAASLIGTYGHGSPEVPVLQLVGYVALATGAAMAAGFLPARRATRTAITAAMADT
ncbi:ABC transporter permease [Luedemannella helvata]|uniref:ABC transporter permease n=1 Tax=Luedemannella helvata TaxID=349315 RepID=A0ABP4XCP7_9ACTN